MEYKCETNRQGRDTGDAYAIQFTDDARFVDVRGSDTEGVAITAVDQGGKTLTHWVIAGRAVSDTPLPLPTILLV